MRTAAIFCLAYGGFAWISVAVDRYHRAALGSAVTRRRGTMLRVVGSLSLALSYIVALRSYSGGIGTVAWVGALCVGATAQTFLLPYWPRAALYAGTALALVSAAASAVFVVQ